MDMVKNRLTEHISIVEFGSVKHIKWLLHRADKEVDDFIRPRDLLDADEILLWIEKNARRGYEKVLQRLCSKIPYITPWVRNALKGNIPEWDYRYIIAASAIFKSRVHVLCDVLCDVLPSQKGRIGHLFEKALDWSNLGTIEYIVYIMETDDIQPIIVEYIRLGAWKSLCKFFGCINDDKRMEIRHLIELQNPEYLMEYDRICSELSSVVSRDTISSMYPSRCHHRCSPILRSK